MKTLFVTRIAIYSINKLQLHETFKLTKYQLGLTNYAAIFKLESTLNYHGSLQSHTLSINLSLPKPVVQYWSPCLAYNRTLYLNTGRKPGFRYWYGSIPKYCFVLEKPSGVTIHTTTCIRCVPAKCYSCCNTYNITYKHWYYSVIITMA